MFTGSCKTGRPQHPHVHVHQRFEIKKKLASYIQLLTDQA